MPHVLSLLFALALVVPAQGVAQSTRAKEQDPPIPKSYLPPAGMCRVWVDNVPAARQPAPTNCATAIRNRPPNARVVFPAGKDGRPAQPRVNAPGRPRTDTTRRKPPA